MKHKSIRWLIAAWLAVVFAGCTPIAHIEKDRSANFSKYHTYAWVDKPVVKGLKKSRKNDLTENNIRNAVNEQLNKKGWREASRNPDILLNYELLVEKTEKEEHDPVYSQSYSRTFYNRYNGRYVTFYYPSQFMGYDYYSTTVKEGTITITMVDNHTDKMVWQGWATSELNSGRITSREVDLSVRAILSKFDTGK